MAEIPASWGLDTRRRDDGRVDIVGRQDDGKEYVAHTTNSDHVTDGDVEALALGDRERITSHEFAQRFINTAERNWNEYESQMLDEYTEAALPVAAAGLGKSRPGVIYLSGNFDPQKRKWNTCDKCGEFPAADGKLRFVGGQWICSRC